MYPYANNVALLHAGVSYCMVTGGKDIQEVERFLIWDTVRDGKKIDIAFRHASIFCLSAGPAPCKMRITEKSSISLAVHSTL